MADKTYQVQWLTCPRTVQASVTACVQQTWDADENDHLKEPQQILALCASNYRLVAQELDYLTRLFQCSPRGPAAEFYTQTDEEGNLYLIGDSGVLGGHPSVLIPGQFVEDPDEDGSEIWLPD